MDQLFTTGRIVDLILVAVALEAAALLILHRRSGRGPGPAALLPNLLAGAALLLALRLSMTGAPWPWLAMSLAGALLAHLADIGMRWRK